MTHLQSRVSLPFHELELILLTASLLVFAVLLFSFRERLVSLLVLFVSILGISGCLLGLFYAGIPLKVSSYTGIIMIVGIIAENAIFTVHQFYESLRETGERKCRARPSPVPFTPTARSSPPA